MKKYRVALSFIFFLFGLNTTNAQSLKQDTLFMPGAVKQFQFHLEKPAERIENLRYENTDESIKGKVSEDGKRIIMDNYKKGQRIKFDAIYKDGSREEVKKSPCYIDPVSYEL
jgi:hypothetical protein